MKLEKVTFFTREPATSAIEHLRVIGPLTYLNVEILPGITNGVINKENIGKGQLLLFQRDFPEQIDDYTEILNLARSASKPVVYDLDDLLINLPEDHPDRQSAYYSKALLPMVQSLVEADYITVSTENLRENLSQFNDQVSVLPNLLDDGIWSLMPPKKPSDSGIVTIGYMGGNSHKPDIEFILPVLLEIAEKYRGKVNFNFYGIQPPTALIEHAEVDWTPIKTFDYREFAADFQKFKADIVIAPLRDTIFNQCKSGIKFLEYSALGMPGVYSDLEPYKKMVTQGESGLLAASLDEWKNSICRLIEDPKLRYLIGINTQELVRDNWLMSKKASLWQERYENIISTGPHESTSRHISITSLNGISSQLIDAQDQYKNKITDLEIALEEKSNQTIELKETNEKLNEEYQKQLNINNSLNLELEKNKGILAETYSELGIKQHDLNEIYISKAWKLAMLLRQARVKLLPPNSKAFKFARKIYRTFTLVRKPKNVISPPIGSPTPPLISVVIPIFDRTELLIESIESILRQTYQNFELILVCDGSPKETLEIVEHYEKTSPKVRAYYFKNNSGNAVRGRNKGIKEARGDYLAFQDSDDIAESDRLQNSLDTIVKFNADIVYGGWRALVDGTREIGIKDGQEIFRPDCDLNLLREVCVPCQSTVWLS